MKKRREFLLLGLDQLTKELPPKETKEIKDSWKGMAIQRLYKILGSFNYLGSQKGKEKFLIFIKPTLEILSALDLTDSRWPFLTKELRKGLLPIESQK